MDRPRAIVSDMANDPTEADLHAAALTHLARYAATRAGLTKVLDRRVERWARAHGADADAVREARHLVRAVVARLAEAGAVNDAAFAEARARSLMRGGRSRRGVAAHLAARGVAAETMRPFLSDAETELAAAVALARRRRIGPFRPVPPDAETRQRELGMLARAGFAREIAIAVLGLEADAAEAMVNRLRGV